MEAIIITLDKYQIYTNYKATPVKQKAAYLFVDLIYEVDEVIGKH